MIKLTVLYKHPSDPAAFDAHYFGTHMPLTDKMPGLVRNEVVKITGGLDGSQAPYYIQTDLVFESAEAMMAGMGSAESIAVVTDMANFESDGAVMFVGEIAR